MKHNSRQAFHSHTYSYGSVSVSCAKPRLSVCVCVCVRLCGSACIVDIFPPLISTRESWGQSDSRLMRGGAEQARQGWQVTLRIPHHCWCLILPSYHAVTLKGLHTYGTHIDVFGLWHVYVRASAWWNPSCLRTPSDPSTHFCLALSLPSRLSFSERTRCDSMFPIAKQSCHSGLGICLISIGVRQCWWEKSAVYQMSLLSGALADRARAQIMRLYRFHSSTVDPLQRIHFTG